MVSCLHSVCKCVAGLICFATFPRSIVADMSFKENESEKSAGDLAELLSCLRILAYAFSVMLWPSWSRRANQRRLAVIAALVSDLPVDRRVQQRSYLVRPNPVHRRQRLVPCRVIEGAMAGCERSPSH
jgi:hypothetical protein